MMKNYYPRTTKIRQHFLSALLVLLISSASSQVIRPFTIQYQVQQKGAITFVANTISQCSGGCAALNENPPAGTGIDNNFNNAYTDIDGDPTTFSSSSDSLDIPNCSQITFAGLYWGGEITAASANYANRNNIKLKVNNGAYIDLTADSSFTNSVGFNTYHAFKDITSIVQAGGIARYTIANMVIGVGASNQFGGWTIVVVYKNDLLDMKNMTVFDGLVDISTSAPSVDFNVSGFLTPTSGPVNLEFGMMVHDGDRSSTGDSLLFKGGSNFIPVFDARNNANDVFNSSLTYNGQNKPFTLPHYLNTLGFDADIFRPNNSTFSYIGNSATSATLRLKTQNPGGETYLPQVVTMAIDIYEADVRLANTVSDLNGGSLNPGDTLEYTVTVKNIGSDTSLNSLSIDTLPFNARYAGGSLRVVTGPNAGAKTDAPGDDQAEYDAVGKRLLVRVGNGANGATGGKIANSPGGDDSTVYKFKVTVTGDCAELACSNVISNRAYITGTSKISTNVYNTASNPAIFDAGGCPISGATNITVNASSCPAPGDTTITNVCPAVTINILADSVNLPGYSFFTSAYAPVTTLVSAGTYYAIRNITASCKDTITITASVANCPPVAVNDAASVNEDGLLNGTSVGANDTDPNGNINPAGYSSTTSPVNGGLSFNNNGTYTYTPNANFNGTDSFTYQVCDLGTPVYCNTATVIITVNAVNDAPVANDDTNTTLEDTPVNGNASTNDADIDGPGANYTVNTNPANGTVVVNGDGTYTYTPALNFNGLDSFTYSVCDGGSPDLCDVATVVITVTAVNDAPVAADDNFSTSEETPLNGTTATNDSDVDGPSANYTVVTTTTNGTLVLNGDGSFTYTPQANFNGLDTFVYSLCDGGSPELCDTAMVIITVDAVNDSPIANDDANSTLEDNPVNGTVSGNDTDVDGPSANYTVDTDPANGTVLVNTDGSYTYTPNSNFNGTDSFTYSLCDGGTPELCDSALVVITVGAVNDAPIAVDDNASTTEDTPLNGTVTPNDSDVDGPAANYTVVTTTSNGTLTVNTDGTFTYTPNSNFNGTDTFTYSLCDGGTLELCDTATVVITVDAVNDAPVAVDDTNTTPEDTPVNGNASTNDSDVDGPGATYTLDVNSINGTVVVNPDGTYTYTPNSNYNGTDSFSYSVCDGGNPDLCDTATVVITVTAVNDAPVATDDTNTTSEDTPVNGNASLNDTDVDGPGANYTVATEPANGTVVVNADGTYTYTPNANYNGTDSFTYSVCDGGTPDLCDTATVVIIIAAVNDAPNAVNDNFNTPQDTPLNANVSTNDSDVDGPAANFTVVTTTTNGTLTLNGDGTFTYTPNAGYTGTDTFVYSLCDGGTPELCDTAVVVIDMGNVNDAPVANDDTQTTNEDTPASGNVSTNDTDVDGPSVNITLVSGPANGTIVLNGDGTYTYTPGANFNGNDTVVYSYCDGGSPDLCDTAILVIIVTAVNDAPVAADDTNTTPEDTPVNGNASTNDSDVDGPGAAYTADVNPANGTVVVNVNGTYAYTPNANFNGVDSFSYSVCDGGTPNLCDTATVVITVTAVNDTPVIGQPPVVLPEDSLFTFCPTISDVDAGDVLTVSICGGPYNGSATLNANCITYAPTANFNGSDSMCVLVCDNGLPALCDTVMVPISVTPVNDPPVIVQPPLTMPQDSTITFCPAISDIDAGDILSVSICGGPSNGVVTVNANCIIYTPVSGFIGDDSMCVLVCDNGNPFLCDTVIVHITVTPVNSPPVANGDNVTTSEDGTLNGTTVLINDTDPDGNINPGSVTLVNGTTHGTLTLNPDGTFTYVPLPNYNGADTFTYSVCDAGTPVYCDTAVVIITVTPVNDPPVANSDNYTTPEDITLNGSTVLANDTDVDGNLDMSSVTVITTTSHGTLVLNGDGTFTYTPDANYSGNDTFTYRVCDTGSPVWCTTATVVITVTPVNDPPVITPVSTQLPEDSFITVCTAITDAEAGDTHAATLCGGPYNGTATASVSSGSLCITYTPNANFNGPDSLCVIVCDNGTPTKCDTTVVHITVTPVNDPPVAVDDHNSSTSDNPVNGSVATNDSDVDGPGASYTVAEDPLHGTLALGTDGSYIYTPGTGFNGCDTMYVSLCDGGTPNLCDTSALIICTTSLNTPPVATDDNGSLPEDSTITINVLLNDADAQDSLSNPALVTQPNHGTATVNNDGTITYVPDANYNGADTFTYVICDGGTPALCDTATVIVTVTPVDDAPDLAVIPIVTSQDSTVTECFDYILDAPGGNVVTATIPCSPQNGSATLSIDQANHQVCVTYIPNPGYNGPDSICITLCDSFGVCVTRTVPVTVTPVDETCYWIKGFSPNGDGQNDAFFINCNDQYPDATLDVFSRWGDEVYQSKGHYNNDWYGRNMQDKDLPDGTYWYIYDYKDGSKKKEMRFVVINR